MLRDSLDREAVYRERLRLAEELIDQQKRELAASLKTIEATSQQARNLENQLNLRIQETALLRDAVRLHDQAARTLQEAVALRDKEIGDLRSKVVKTRKQALLGVLLGIGAAALLILK